MAQIRYKGRSEGFQWRLAEIGFTDDEMDKMIRIEKLLNIMGWTDFSVVTDGYAACNVRDYDEYREFVEDWKKAKKCIGNCIKFGF